MHASDPKGNSRNSPKHRKHAHPNGQAKAAINIPNDSRLSGVKTHTAFVTLSPSAPFGIKSISNTYSITVQ